MFSFLSYGKFGKRSGGETKNSAGAVSLALILAGVIACSKETIKFCGHMLLAGTGLVILTDIYYSYIKR